MSGGALTSLDEEVINDAPSRHKASQGHWIFYIARAVFQEPAGRILRSTAMQCNANKQNNTWRTKRKHFAQSNRKASRAKHEAKQRNPKERNAGQSKAEQSTKQKYALQSEEANGKTDVATQCQG